MIQVKDLHIRDPFILPYNNGYVMCGTSLENGFNAYFSEDLNSFEGPYELFIGDDNKFKRHNYWAPEIHFYNGKYYMFATLLPVNGNRFSQIFVSDSPLGKFEPLCKITPDEWGCLDATLYVEDGVPYAVFCHEWLQVTDGEMCAIQLEKDLSKTVGEPFLLFKATDAAWVHSISSRAYDREYNGYVTDGPYLFKDCNKLKMLWSSFGSSGNYAQTIAQSTSGKLRGTWEQESEPFYPNNGGHGMILKKDDGIYMTLHAPNSPSGQERLQLVKLK